MTKNVCQIENLTEIFEQQNIPKSPSSINLLFLLLKIVKQQKYGK